MKSLMIAAIIIAGPGAVAGTGPRTTHHAPARPAIPVVTVTARNYAFDAPDSIAAGLTTLRIENKGTELHHLSLVRFVGGKTAADFVNAMKAGGSPPAWAHDIGGPNVAVPGGAQEATLMLDPGNYAMLCYIPSADSVPHVMKGMLHPFVVTAHRGPRAAAPKADLTIHLADYAFAPSKPLTAGTHTIRVVNDGPQSHELVLARLAPGKTVQELAAWAETMAGPPPAEPMGGATPMEKGREIWFTQTFTPGDYAVLCFVPDAKDGKPHVAHGMMLQLKVE
jgi:hypothetical protein